VAQRRGCRQSNEVDTVNVFLRRAPALREKMIATEKSYPPVTDLHKHMLRIPGCPKKSAEADAKRRSSPVALWVLSHPHP